MFCLHLDLPCLEYVTLTFQCYKMHSTVVGGRTHAQESHGAADTPKLLRELPDSIRRQKVLVEPSTVFA